MLDGMEAGLRGRDGKGRTRPDLASPGVHVRRLSLYANLSDDELALLDGIVAGAQHVPVHTQLLGEREKLDRPRLMLAGWGCLFRTLSDGRRQIFQFILPGDIYGLSHRPQAAAQIAATALTSCTIADASALGDAVLHAPDNHPGLAGGCAAVAALDEAWQFNQLMRVGRQTAYERLSHLFLEIAHRLDAVGLANGGMISVPLTQEIIADAMGLSVVHLNRTLQQLRRDGLIEFKNGTVRILKPEKLAEISDFRAPQTTH